MKRICMAVLIVLLFAMPGHSIVVSPNNNGEALASSILGSGITASNFSYTGAAAASGTFTAGGSIGIGSGLIMTSGSVYIAPGPNNSDAASVSNGLGGDAALNGLIPGYSTHDATVLEFDFTSATENLYFNYVFASEEYNEWVGSQFNDVFGFFLDGMNIALIPGTTTAVAINNVNTASHSELYNNNDPSNISPIPYNDIQYDGFTDVLTAQYLGLTPGTHHIKLAIADAGDWVLDSAVFIQAGTFSGEPTPPNPIPEPGTMLLLGSGLSGLLFVRKRMKK